MKPWLVRYFLNITTKIPPTGVQDICIFRRIFSNYIEGTEFTVTEAKEIITSEMPIPSRDEDSFDILGTYRIVSDQIEMSSI